jgi:hypothetical protein
MDRSVRGALRQRLFDWRYTVPLGAMFFFALMNLAGWIVFLAEHGEVWAFSDTSSIVIDVHGGYDSRLVAISRPHPGGFRTGDRFSAAALPFAERLKLYGYTTVGPGDAVDLTVLRDGRRVRLHVPAVEISFWSRWQVTNEIRGLLTTLAGIVALAFACWLVLMRPGAMTRGFAFFTFGTLFATSFYPLPVPGLVAFAALSLTYAVQYACPWGFVTFCARFPDGTLPRAVRPVERAAAVFAGGLGLLSVFRNCAGVLYPIATVPGWFLGDEHDALMPRLFYLGPIGIFALGVLAMWLRYRRLDPAGRAKVRIVFAALLTVALAAAVADVLSFVQPLHSDVTLADEITGWLNASYVIVPPVVLYAIVRYRVVDVRFVLDRTVVYALLTVLLVGALRLVNFVVSAQLAQHRLAIAVELGVTLAFAVSLDQLRGRLEHFVRAVLFRKREEGLRSIEQLRTAIAAVQVPELVDVTVVSEAVSALSLTSAAIYRREGGDSPLTLVAARSASETDGEVEPVFVCPIVVGNDVIARGTFGGHTNGADLDPDERAALQRLVETATHVVDRLRAQQLERELSALRATVAT